MQTTKHNPQPPSSKIKWPQNSSPFRRKADSLSIRELGRRDLLYCKLLVSECRSSFVSPCIPSPCRFYGHKAPTRWRRILVGLRNDNKRIFTARTEITNLKAHVDSLKKSKVDYQEKYKEAKSHRERVEVLQVELSQQLISKDKDLDDKDAEVVELQRRLREAQENLEAKK
ncbi:hypothetical protein Hanom_Chr13g01204221 [Helianthus anomalus]